MVTIILTGISCFLLGILITVGMKAEEKTLPRLDGPLCYPECRRSDYVHMPRIEYDVHMESSFQKGKHQYMTECWEPVNHRVEMLLDKMEKALTSN